MPRWQSRTLRTAGQIGPVRLIACVIVLALALIVARQGWTLPLTVDAERALYDWRVDRAAPRVAQDERMVMVVYTDETLEAVAKRSPLDRKMLADALRAIDAMNPKAIGIDILIDQPQEEDSLLLETFRQLKTPTYLAFASNATNPDYMRVWQEEFLTGFLKQSAPGPVRPTSIMLQPDGDNVIRRWPDQPASLPPLFANALAPGHEAFRAYRGAIHFPQPKSPEYPVISRLPIDLFASELAPAMRAQIEGRYVLIGGDIQDLDDYQTPLTRQTGEFMKGLEVHARLLAQMLDGRMPQPIPGWALWIAALGVVAAGALTSLLEMRGWKLGVAFVGQLAFFVALPFYLATTNVDTLDLPAFGWGVGWILAFLAVGTAARAVGSEQKRFAQSALGKYLPADIAAQILKDPELLALRGEKKQIYALFTDLEGFTKLSHAITPEQLSDLLNRYLDVMSDTVLKHGGTIDKFVGDAVVAFWGAPIERPDDADRACRAAVEMFEAGEAFARSAGPELPKIGCTRVGLHRGEAVVGNFGGEGRIQYTALGDGMNTAARLESANKYLKTTVLVSDEAKRESGADIFRPMGRIVLSGRATPVAVWEPVPQMDSALREKINALWQRYDGGDAAALSELESLSASQPDDAALANFVYRVREAGPGGHFVLGSK
ncbi:adenylate/guanylate cyclase domain-containing protein [Allosphingosinicella indica]|uniref:Adenylate/guanylate cyclase n=1 Tax=Allosphingosinicella indica TaxID=941907 RepID=A0A1X7GJQ8_9SPHN|nr:adenylate/guanylate cyclase domain-containing protein [Allosphingosinicella indica]SMF70839.1 adenylate/guanylate cyclase [Allosphingosinicella indica]